MLKKFHIIAMLVLLMPISEAFSQEIKAGVDLMSRYNWRGKDFGASPSVQPKIEYSIYKFTIGTWGAFTTNGRDVQEHDIYFSYNIADLFSVIATDYFFPADSLAKNNYFEYGEDITGHNLEIGFKFNGLESLPLSVAFYYNFYGFDKDHSQYLELIYTSSAAGTKYDMFLCTTFGKGIYGDTFGVCNFGVTAYKDIEITEKFSLPLLCRFITNPQLENIHLIFGITL